MHIYISGFGTVPFQLSYLIYHYFCLPWYAKLGNYPICNCIIMAHLDWPTNAEIFINLCCSLGQYTFTVIKNRWSVVGRLMKLKTAELSVMQFNQKEVCKLLHSHRKCRSFAKAYSGNNRTKRGYTLSHVFIVCTSRMPAKKEVRFKVFTETEIGGRYANSELGWGVYMQFGTTTN